MSAKSIHFFPSLLLSILSADPDNDCHKLRWKLIRGLPVPYMGQRYRSESDHSESSNVQRWPMVVNIL